MQQVYSKHMSHPLECQPTKARLTQQVMIMECLVMFALFVCCQHTSQSESNTENPMMERKAQDDESFLLLDRSCSCEDNTPAGHT